MIQIPTDFNSPSFRQTIQLGASVYSLTFTWNGREEFWYMDIAMNINDPIVSGIKLVVDWSLINRFADARLPTGHIVALDLSGQGLDAARNDLGSRVALIFMTDEEFAAA